MTGDLKSLADKLGILSDDGDDPPDPRPGELYANRAQRVRAQVIEQAADQMLESDLDPPVRIVVWRKVDRKITYEARIEEAGHDAPVAIPDGGYRAEVLAFDADDLARLKSVRQKDE